MTTGSTCASLPGLSVSRSGKQPPRVPAGIPDQGLELPAKREATGQQQREQHRARNAGHNDDHHAHGPRRYGSIGHAVGDLQDTRDDDGGYVSH